MEMDPVLRQHLRMEGREAPMVAGVLGLVPMVAAALVPQEVAVVAVVLRVVPAVVLAEVQTKAAAVEEADERVVVVVVVQTRAVVGQLLVFSSPEKKI